MSSSLVFLESLILENTSDALKKGLGRSLPPTLPIGVDMDVNSFRAAFSALLFFSFVGCSQPTPESITPSEKSSCVDSRSIKDTFLVRYKNGAVKKYPHITRDAFIDSVATPEFENIDVVEFDRKIELTPPDSEVFSIVEKLNAPLLANSVVDKNWGVNNVNLTSAHAQGYRGQGVIVAVVDSGIDIRHPQLINRLLENPGEDGLDNQGVNKRINGRDDDGNGYIDDFYGYDFYKKSGYVGDSLGHGTHVAGIIAGEANNSNAHIGVAPEAKILPVAFLGEQGGTLGDSILAIDYAVSRGAQIINASWGGTQCSRILGDQISALNSKGILFVSAAGNNSSNIDRFPEYPASFNLGSQITVGSISYFNGMASHSNYGEQSVHVFAPGVDILSTLPNEAYAQLTGTSMATPFVAGAAALLKSALPSATPEALKRAIFSGVNKNSAGQSGPSAPPSYKNSTGGRLDVSKSLSLLLNAN